jgi:hypothetical protein
VTTPIRVAPGEPLVTEVAMAKNIAIAACGGPGHPRAVDVERHEMGV